MKRFILITIFTSLILGAYKLEAQEFFFNKYKGENYVLLVFSPNTSNPVLYQQRSNLKRRVLKKHNIKYFEVFPEAVWDIKSRIVHRLDDFEPLLKNFSVDWSSLHVVLLGIDGIEITRWSRPVEIDELIDQIE